MDAAVFVCSEVAAGKEYLPSHVRRSPSRVVLERRRLELPLLTIENEIAGRPPLGARRAAAVLVPLGFEHHVDSILLIHGDAGKTIVVAVGNRGAFDVTALPAHAVVAPGVPNGGNLAGGDE